MRIIIPLVAIVAIYVGGLVYAQIVFFGVLPGIYWVHQVWVTIAPFFGGAVLVAGLAILLIGLIRLTRLQSQWLGSIGCVWIIAAVFILVIMMLPRTQWKHQDTVRLGSNMYHVAAYTTWVESHFTVFKCGPLGVVCWPIYHHALDEGVVYDRKAYTFSTGGGLLRVYRSDVGSPNEPLYEYRP